jgi:RNA polymerase sigma-70 factor (ECF subfamily)
MNSSAAVGDMTVDSDGNSSGDGQIDLAAFGEFVREHTAYVWRVLRSLGVREVDLEDVCQEAFMVVHRRAQTYEARGSLRSWIYGIALRVASDYRGKAHRRREVLTAEPPHVSTEPAQELAADTRRAFEMVDKLLAGLSEEQRQVFVLYELEELGMREISDIVGCPLQTAYSRLNSARRVVRERVARMRKGDSSP